MKNIGPFPTPNAAFPKATAPKKTFTNYLSILYFLPDICIYKHSRSSYVIRLRYDYVYQNYPSQIIIVVNFLKTDYLQTIISLKVLLKYTSFVILYQKYLTFYLTKSFALW